MILYWYGSVNFFKISSCSVLNHPTADPLKLKKSKKVKVLRIYLDNIVVNEMLKFPYLLKPDISTTSKNTCVR